MQTYRYPQRTAATTNAKLLRDQISALGLPGWSDFTRDLQGVLTIDFPDPLSTRNADRLQAVIANHDPTQMTEWQQQQLAAETAREADRTAAKDAMTTLGKLPPNAPLTAGTLKPILKWMDRLGMLE